MTNRVEETFTIKARQTDNGTEFNIWVGTTGKFVSMTLDMAQKFLAACLDDIDSELMPSDE